MTPGKIHSFFQLHTICRLQRSVALDLMRSALSNAGAYVTDIRHLSNKATVLQVMLKPEKWNSMVDELTSAGAAPESEDRGYPESVKPDSDGDITGTIQVLYVSDEPDVRDEIPAVPG